MNRLSVLLAATLALILAHQAGATTYTLSNATYTKVSGVYSGATGVTGSFTTAVPLPAGLTLASIASGAGGLGYVTSWSFSDGVNTYTDLNSGPLSNNGAFFSVSTDGAGAITDMRISLVSPLFVTASKQANRIDLDFIAATKVAALVAGIYTCPGGVVGGLCGTFFLTSSFADGTTGVFTAGGLPPCKCKNPNSKVCKKKKKLGLCM
ncbi:MAG: hypothetical protein C5B56_10570 [Proteobacteria bacterium]|nr:MAG: hypothetical protein C5B56_10570 [Pseudomonadota bacterium]